MTKLLIDDYPLVILPELARLIGLNEAVILQQIHYWIQHNKKSGRNFRDGHHWTYSSYTRWQQQFSFWSVSTIRRAFKRLGTLELLITDNFNPLPIDRTLWYRVNYEKLERLVDGTEPTIRSKCADQVVNPSRPIQETPEETTHKPAAATTISSDWEEAYADNIGRVTPVICQSLDQLSAQFPYEWFVDAVREALESGHSHLKYITAILTRWKSEGKNAPRRKKTPSRYPPARP